MTEPRVEAGDRALETARKLAQDVKEQAAAQKIVVTLEETGKWAALIQSAMNAQERELRRAYELAHIFAKKIAMLALTEKSYDEYSSAWKELAEAERLLAERGGTQ